MKPRSAEPALPAIRHPLFRGALGCDAFPSSLISCPSFPSFSLQSCWSCSVTTQYDVSCFSVLSDVLLNALWGSSHQTNYTPLLASQGCYTLAFALSFFASYDSNFCRSDFQYSAFRLVMLCLSLFSWKMNLTAWKLVNMKKAGANKCLRTV